MRRYFLAGFFLCLMMVVACAAISYPYYGLDLPDECYDRGTLLGKQGNDGWKDLPYKVCKPDDQKKGKCWIQLSEDYFAKENELLQCRASLKQCQANCAPTLSYPLSP